MAKEFADCVDKQIIKDMVEKLSEKFASEKHAGAVDVSDFLDLLDKEEIEMVRRDVYEHVQALIERIRI